MFFELADAGIFAFRGPVLESCRAVVEEFLLPAVELVYGDVEFLAEVGDLLAADKVSPEDGDNLRA